MKRKLIFIISLPLALPFYGCSSTIEIRHSGDRKNLIFEKPLKFTYNLELTEYISKEMRKGLNISEFTPRPEIILKNYGEKDLLGVQYEMRIKYENGLGWELKVAEIYYEEIHSMLSRGFFDQKTFEATIYDVGIHEVLHAYYDYKYKEEHQKILENNDDYVTIGKFDHCKMIETGDLKKYTDIVDKHFNNQGIAQRDSLERTEYACNDSNEEIKKILKKSKKEDKRYKCLLK